MLENLRPDIGKPQIACRPFEEAYLELILQLSDAATDGGERYLEASRRFRETLRLDDFGEDRQWNSDQPLPFHQSVKSSSFGASLSYI